MTTVTVGQVEIDDRGVAYVGRSRMKVSQIVLARNVAGMSPEEIADAYDPLTLADVFTAMAYFAAHQADIDAQIAHEEARIDDLRTETQNQALQEKLRRLVTLNPRQSRNPVLPLRLRLR